MKCEIKTKSRVAGHIKGRIVSWTDLLGEKNHCWKRERSDTLAFFMPFFLHLQPSALDFVPSKFVSLNPAALAYSTEHQNRLTNLTRTVATNSQN